MAKPWRVAIAIGGIGALAIGAFVLVGNRRAAEHRSRLEREARRAWAETAYCLLGDPADSQPKRGEQLHRIALGASGDPVELALGAERRWPRRCARSLDRLADAWRGLEPSARLAGLAHQTASDLEQGHPPEPAPFSELWLGALERFGIPSGLDAKTVTPPPRAATHPALASLEPLFELPPRVLRIRRPGELHLAGEDELVVVESQPNGPGVRRSELRQALELHTHLLFDRGAPSLVAVHVGPENTALATLDAETLIELKGRALTGFVGSDGSIVAHSAHELVRRDARGKVVRQTLPPSAPHAWTRLAGSHLLERSPDGALGARAIGARALGPRRELGTTSIESPTLEPCKTESHLFVLLHERNREVPAELVVLGPERARRFELPRLRQRLSCSGPVAVTLALEKTAAGLGVVETTCDAERCKTERSAVHAGLAIDPALGDERLVDAVRVGDRIAVAWRADKAVRIKVATRDALAKTPAQVVAEDPPPGAPDSVFRFRLESTGDGAVLLLDATRGSFGFFVTPLGVLPLSAD